MTLPLRRLVGVSLSNLSCSFSVAIAVSYTHLDVYKRQTVGDEGGFAPNLPSNEAAIQLIMESISDAGYEPGRDVYLGLDCASTEFYKDGKYHLESEGLALSSAQFTDYLATWCDKYPIISIEDGMGEFDWEGWEILTKRLGKTTQLVGDDLFVTNAKILREGIQRGVANSVLIKVNQIGTLTETFQTIEMAKRAGYTCLLYTSRCV